MVGDLGFSMPRGQRGLLHRPVVWTTKSKPSVPRTWRRRSTKGTQDASGRRVEGQEGDPERSDEERVALWEESGRLSGLRELPGGGGPRGPSLSSLASLPLYFPPDCSVLMLERRPPISPTPAHFSSQSARKGGTFSRLAQQREESSWPGSLTAAFPGVQDLQSPGLNHNSDAPAS